MGFSDVYRSVLKDYPDVLTVEEMSRALGISTKTGYKLIRENKIDFVIAHWTYAVKSDKLVSANSRSPIDLHKGGYYYGSRTSARKERYLLHGAVLPQRERKTQKQMDFNQASGKGK